MQNVNSGLYYKHTAIVNYTSNVVNKLEALLTDDDRVVIYDCHVFMVQATVVKITKITFYSESSGCKNSKLYLNVLMPS